MFTVTKKQPVEGGQCYKRDWTARLIFTEVGHCYKLGFGNLNGEFWLGQDKMNRLTKEGTNRIRVDLEDTKGNTAYADYDLFAVTSDRAKYQLSLGTYSGEGMKLNYIDH